MDFLKRAQTLSVNENDVSNTVKDILANVKTNGERAVKYYEDKFGGARRENLRVTDDEIHAAITQLTPDVKALIEVTVERVKRFAEAQLSCLQSFEAEFDSGIILGHRFIPIDSIGAYVPGGRFPLLSSAAMVVVPAHVAGVSRIVACSPANFHGSIHPAVLYGLHLSGASEIFAIGGAQAIGAMAYGMDGMAPVNLISGPGNRYVAEAKKQIFGEVGIDLIAGPSEILVFADNSADPLTIAKDLLAQAEHDPSARAILVTDSRKLAEDTGALIAEILLTQPPEWPAQKSWPAMGEIVVVDSIDEGIDVCNDYAIEHLHVQTKNPRELMGRLRNYGSLFLGADSSVVFSDKVSGTNHTLPTKKAATYTGGLWVGTYLKAVTHQEIVGEGVSTLALHASTQSKIEGLIGHEMSAAARIKQFIR